MGLLSPEKIIQQLQLRPHPEGGYYRETYRSQESLKTNQDQTRNVCTAIFYLLQNDDKSNFHRIRSDELWFFHQGQALEILSIENDTLKSIILGNDFEKGEVPQAVIPAETWFAARIKNASGYSLVSCTVSPGFDFSDFELADRKKLTEEYPHLTAIIEEFTRS